jgi:hypothetical protein
LADANARASRFFASLSFSSSRGLVLDVNSVEASDVLWNVSVVPSVDLVVTAQDDINTEIPAIIINLNGKDIIRNMAVSFPDMLSFETTS